MNFFIEEYGVIQNPNLAYIATTLDIFFTYDEVTQYEKELCLLLAGVY